MRVTVAGTGYVGLVTGVCLSELGHQVTCIDINQKKINQLQSGNPQFTKTGLNPYYLKILQRVNSGLRLIQRLLIHKQILFYSSWHTRKRRWYR